MDGIKILCSKFNVPFKPFEEAYNRALEKGIKYSSYWKKEKKNKSRSWSGQIYMELDFGVSKIEAHLTNTKTGELIKKLLVNPKPNYMYFDRFLGKYYWDDKGRFCLESKNKLTVLKASLSNS